MRFSPIAASSALALFIAASPALASFDDQFVCEPTGDGHYVVTISSEDSSKASVVYVLDGENADGGTPEVTKLTATPSASGFRYTGGTFEFHGKGTEGLLNDGSQTVTCLLAVADEMDEDDREVDIFDDGDWPPHHNEYGNTNTNRERSSTGSGGGTESHGNNP